ncbi:MAG: hypothetical protein WKF81_06760 [Thermomicrobiales bacterium]
MHVRNGLRRRAEIVAVLMTLLLIGLVSLQEVQRQTPDTRIEMEAEIDTEFLAYEVMDGVPLAVYERAMPMHLFDGVCLDQMHLDWMAAGFRFSPEWEWSGSWSCIDRTNDPASAGSIRGWWGDLIYGQVNDAAIVAVEGFVDGEWVAYPVAAPGYLVVLPEGSERPVEFRFVDANGVVVWSIDPRDEENKDD